MKFTIYGKNMHVSENLKDELKKKFAKFDRYFGPETEVYATFSREKDDQMLEVTIPMGKTILRAEESTDDMISSIENVVDKLEGQMRKHKTKLQKRYAADPDRFHFDLLEEEDYDEDFEEDDSKIVRTKKFAVKPMSVEEAALQMDLIGHSFFVFLNAETEIVNVVYKRKDGNYGLIEPIF